MTLSFQDKKGRSFETPAPLAPLADTHGHLTHFRHTDATSALLRSAQAGLQLLVMPIDPVDELGPDKRFSSVEAFDEWLEESYAQAQTQARSLGLILPELYYVAGVHPYGAAEYDEAAEKRLRALLDHPRCLGVGEFGFDFGPWSKVSQPDQERAFVAQLALAKEYAMPVELHLRDPEKGEPLAHSLAEELLRKHGVPEAGCNLHCFTSGPELVKGFCELGCYIAFGGAVTFSRSDDIRAALLACPDELILSETDSPYMTPTPLRGTECEPAMLAYTVSYMAELRSEELGIAPETSYQQLFANAQRFLGLV